jgi:two-component system phosphate regulon response regulator PhoB
VDMHIQRLRAKLGAAGDLIETVRGFGYRLKAGQSRSA